MVIGYTGASLCNADGLEIQHFMVWSHGVREISAWIRTIESMGYKDSTWRLSRQCMLDTNMTNIYIGKHTCMSKAQFSFTSAHIPAMQLNNIVTIGLV